MHKLPPGVLAAPWRGISTPNTPYQPPISSQQYPTPSPIQLNLAVRKLFIFLKKPLSGNDLVIHRESGGSGRKGGTITTLISRTRIVVNILGRVPNAPAVVALPWDGISTPNIPIQTSYHVQPNTPIFLAQTNDRRCIASSRRVLSYRVIPGLMIP